MLLIVLLALLVSFHHDEFTEEYCRVLKLIFQLIYAAFFFFRLSQKIEPGTSTPRANASKEDLVGEFSLT